MKLINLNTGRLLPLMMAAILAAPLCTSCLDDDDDKNYDEWKAENEQFVATQETSGNYERISPVWAPGIFVLMKYHVRPANYATLIPPMSTSTVDVKYRGMLIDSTQFDSSFSQTTYGDSIYRCVPNKMVPGFWTALTNMVPGDSVTVIIPAQAGYGVDGSGATIKPYSTLIFDIKMKQIVKYDY